MANSFAPVQFLRTDWNPDIWTAVDNSTDQRTSLAITLANAAVLPDDKEKFQVGCILIQKAEKQIYLNVGTDIIPDWQPFGPGTNTLPTPFVPGQYLTNDGTTAFWALVDLATGVTGILDITHLDMSQIIDYLLNDTDFLTDLANNTTFIDALFDNTDFIDALTTVITDIINNSTTPIGTGVKVDADDTTSGFLDDKIEVVSTDLSVIVNKTITNPAGNEKLKFDLSVTGLGTNNIASTLTAGQDLVGFTAAVIGDGSTNTIAQQTFSGIGVSFPVDMSVEKVSAQIDTSADSFVLSGFTFSNRGTSGAQTGDIKVSLQTDNSGEASGTVLTSVTIPFSTVPSLGSNSVTFTTPYTLQPSTTYWVVIEGVTASGTIDFSTALNAAASRHFYTGGVWTNTQNYVGSSLLAIFEGGKVYQASNSTGIGTFQAVPGFGGNAITNAPLINTLDGIVTSTVSVGNSVTLVTEGFLDGFTGLTAGTIYEVGVNGTLTASGGKQIGKAVSTTKVNIRQYTY